MALIQTTEVFDEWFNSLRDRTAQLRITARIRRLSQGNPGDSEPVGEGVAELRIHYGPGYRVYYVTRAGITYILLCGGNKKTQPADIKQAKRMAKNV